jgi:small-conductance mechanosensitive channel
MIRGQMIRLAILCAFGWLVTFVLTGKWFVFPILFVGLVVVAIHRAREKQRRIAVLAADAAQSRQEAEEAQAEAHQLDALAEAAEARRGMETRSAFMWFVNPN